MKTLHLTDKEFIAVEKAVDYFICTYEPGFGSEIRQSASKAYKKIEKLLPEGY
jgi:hypothetical protein